MIAAQAFRVNYQVKGMSSTETELLLRGHGMTTAEILYRMPDARAILQTFVWQDYDLAPDFPKLTGFLDYWREELDGPLHSVRYCHERLIKPGEWRRVNGEFLIN